MKKAYSMKISTKLILWFSLFVLVVLGCLWLFQVLLLDDIYGAVRVSEVKDVAEAAEKALEAADTREAAYDIGSAAYRKLTCVTVYRIVNTVSEVALDFHVSDGCRIHDAGGDAELLNRLYISARNEGGTYVGRIPELGGGKHHPTIAGSAFCVKLLSRANGSEYMIVANAEVTPLTSTVSTLRRQLTWISLTIAILALGLALLIARTVARPLSKLNEGAKELARGRYGADFRSRGYRETEELGETLQYAAEELAQTEKLRRELIANVSHDLRTPLTMIGGYAEIMRDIPGEITPENLQIIVDETARLSSLVNDLLDVSKFMSGTEQMRAEIFDMSATAAEAVSHYAAMMEPQGYRIRFVGEGAAPVRADRKRIRQVLYNLLSNAIHYTGEDKAVTVTQTVIEGRVRISVRDTGEGIAAADLPRIWERYYKVDKVHRRAAVGTGLGLSIVKSILDAHGAKFGVSSEPGRGSDFWFELPVVK